MSSHAYRNINRCTKDCLCLFVCPTGATDNETGQIDFAKCIGCGACAQACPSRAITMLPNVMPKIQPKSKEMVDELFKIADNKIKEIQILKSLLTEEEKEENKLIKALIHSNKVVIEDIMREAEFMIPECPKAHELLVLLSKNTEVQDIANKLLEKIEVNE